MPDPRQWERLAERKIREALEEGAFDNLAGAGRPLSLDEDPFEPADLRMAHRLLKNNGFAPEWIEEAKDLDASIEILRRNLDRGWSERTEPEPLRRERLLESFREPIAALNRRILAYNLKAPSLSVHKLALDPAAEIARAAQAARQFSKRC